MREEQHGRNVDENRNRLQLLQPEVQTTVASSHEPGGIINHGIPPGKRPQGHQAVHLRREVHPQGEAREQHVRADPRKLLGDGIGEGDDGVPGPGELNLGFADRTQHGLVFALAVGDPGEHARLVRFQRAGTWVDPVFHAIGGLLVVEADKTSSHIITGHVSGCLGVEAALKRIS